ncbi:HAMP domain-containing sensor histidine kinase [Kineosporia sp. A_224]|uniref:HAMP domain-containing sensor histidine kinase n=1 Tax=Kineosporia sp. A_224 TaxID=1962180 RepID=UPI000B4AC412|nr:HAMP domain-containing sensor histidine kinase [Kineosporia sp. A_224]
MSGPAAGPTTATSLGPLGRRLLASFVLVALVAVALVATAGLVGSSLGVSRTTAQSRALAAQRVAAAAATGYSVTGEWAGSDLTAAVTTAAAAGARLAVLDDAGRAVTSTGRGQGMGMGSGMGTGMGMGGAGTATTGGVQVTEPVLVAGTRVGTVLLTFPAADTGGRRLAWSWILVAAVAAVAVAVAAGWYVVRLLTRPLVALTDATRAFGAGDVTARPAERGVGELGELAGAFDQAAQAVAEQQRLRRQMTADVAHELRTPLTALQAGLEELRDGLVEPDRETLTRLHDQALRVTRTVAELSELSAADAAAAGLHRAPADLGAVTGEALDARLPQLRAAGLAVTRDLAGGVLVALDPDRWHQVVGNLLDNCARHCRPGDIVRVQVAPADGGTARLVVADSGPGIAPDELPHVLERFWRGRDRHAVAGSGVGLAVVARLVEAHDGAVVVTSDGASGTTVTVTLPAMPPAVAQDAGRPGQALRRTTSASTA